MSLTPGIRLGPFEIVAPLGAGGMGEVYRARDTRLGREVAIKALPPAFAQDPERLARFEREAKLLASLNHPNVAGIHGLEVVEGHRYLVLELVEGESLAERLARGALPIDEAVEVCRQVAAGVEAAHEAGVVHRDLKPGNVMLRPDGTVKVLDFGLAKGGSGGGTGADTNLSASPTMTYAATTAGMILGTAAYMSPEQARGRAVDKRSDVWSFGCVLYECLTARQTFHGETVSDLIASILKTDADMSALPAATPARLRELLGRCLNKDPRERLRDIGEARVILSTIRADEGAPAAPAAVTVRSGVPAWAAVAAALVLAALAVVLTRQFSRTSAQLPTRTFDLVADGIEMDWFFTPQLSPDGRLIAYISGNRIWVRNLEQLEPRAVADVDGIAPICWSPDARTLVYADRKKLWRVPIESGAPALLCEVPGTGDVIGAACSAKGTLAFSVWRGGMYEVPLSGGPARLMFPNDPATVVDFHDPSWLPNGDLLHTIHWKTRSDTTGTARPSLAVFDGKQQRQIPGALGSGVSMPAVTEAGHLLYVRRDATPGIWAAHYDVRGRRVSGEPRLVAAGAASFSLSHDGSLLYMEAGNAEAQQQMVWVGRSGRIIEEIGVAHPGLSHPVLSPDGRRVAFSVTKGGNQDVWVRDLVRGIDTRITFSPADESGPQWMSSTRVAYMETTEMRVRILAVNADGSGGQSVVAPALGNWGQRVRFAPGTDRVLRLVFENGKRRLRQATMLADGGLTPPEALMHAQPEPDIEDARLSSDGQLAAYSTDDPGQPEVYLTRFPNGAGPWQVSNEGGRNPRWSRSGRELFYIAGSGPSRRSMVSVAIDPAQDPPVAAATTLFAIDPKWIRSGEMSYDLSLDGERLLAIQESASAAGRRQRMILVQNWETRLTEVQGR